MIRTRGKTQELNMRKVWLALLIGLVLCVMTSGMAWGEDSLAGDDHPLDEPLEKCLEGEGATSTQATVRCYMSATEVWDAALNDAYKSLREQLDSESAQDLKEVQQKWMAYRDADIRLAAGLIDGTIRQVLAAQAEYERTRERALTLESYLGALQDSK
ncbi:hypothetical protein DQK91_21765 [Oceanidesulfovibrio marinus]|uniref:Lysozyme inhibitor LprI-like N-terminal domain-containing protein n=2 Tax=Oceanidesulfovibrio marinus TaxID=370038 RepID=A0A6P1ZB14_9BACT|nr:hypothetical protein DQK91_21765 [Oceanidesulfovibrio marinus]